MENKILCIIINSYIDTTQRTVRPFEIYSSANLPDVKNEPTDPPSDEKTDAVMEIVYCSYSPLPLIA